MVRGNLMAVVTLLGNIPKFHVELAVSYPSSLLDFKSMYEEERITLSIREEWEPGPGS